MNFVPGRIGQALKLDGDDTAKVPWTGYYRIAATDSTVALYIKLASLNGEQTILEAMSDQRSGLRFVISPENHLRLEVLTKSGKWFAVDGQRGLQENQWYQVAFTIKGPEVVLFSNGEQVARDILPEDARAEAGQTLYFGGNSTTARGSEVAG